MPLSDDDIKQMLDAGITEDEIAKELESDSGASAPTRESDVPSLPDASVPDSAKQPTDWREIAKPIAGPLMAAGRGLESGAEMATGIPAGLVNVVKTIKHGYANIVGAGDENWREGMVSGYQPKTLREQDIPSVIGGGINALKEKTKALLEQHGHPALAASVDPALEIGSDVAQLFGARGLAKGAASDIAKSAIKSDSEKQALLDATLKKSPDDYNTLKTAMDAGYKIQKSMIPGQGGSILEDIAGKQGAASALSEANQPLTNSLAKADLGIPESEPINSKTISNKKSEAYQNGYDPIKNYGLIKTNKEYMDALDDIKAEEDLSNQQFGRKKSEIADIVEPLKQKNIDSNAMINEIQDYRAKATAEFSGDRPNLKMAHAYSKAADAMEQAIEDHLTATGETDLLQNFQDARKKIAVANMYDKAVIQGSNNISAPVLAREFQSGGSKYMTDNAPKIAAFANLFQKAVKTPSQVGQKSGSGLHTHIAASSGKDFFGALKRTLLSHYAPKAAQKAITSDVYQQGLIPSETVKPSLLSKLPQQESPMNPAYALPGFLNSTEDQQQ